MSEEVPRPSSKVRAMMAVPLGLSVLALVGAVVLALRMQAGRQPTGERVRMRIETDCPGPATVVLQRRVEEIGLGEPVIEPVEGGLSLTATLPGLPDDRVAIPALLATPGVFEVRAGGRTVATGEDVSGTALNMDAGGVPYTEIGLNGLAFAELRETAAKGGTIEVLLDGATILSEDPGQLRDARLRIFPVRDSPAERMRAAADLSVLLGAGALPCAVRIAELSAAP